MAKMNQRRVGGGVAVLDDVLYVIGGSKNYLHSLRSCEKYDVETNKWSRIASK